ncbi:hypothetical protein BB560_001504 [Smittium megazygosporum]|uniref:ABC transporter domain-containing protein n=1 Tax=Smittium megazygosporum TaxID=133381 RepID=A0A2T9ZHD2_9FUNG|nr:hypothetical protein BB560_001504 [Smittium megazygosporum]
MSADSSAIVIDSPSNPSLSPIAADKRPEAEISFQNLTYTVQIEDSPSAGPRNPILSRFKRKKSSLKEKVIINNITGTFQPGSLTAVLGSDSISCVFEKFYQPSGSGKTTLMNLLSGRISSGSVSGNVWLNGRKADNGALRLVSRYINQEDVMLPTMSVREILQMAIKFRVKNITPDDLELRVQYAIKTLKLENCQNTMIGDSIKKGISGGERKRTAIAMEMATNSSILLLDEPTSGLDSYTSILVNKLLCDIARSGQTVICVIHQPSSEIFEMFDNVLVMNFGSIVYFGPRSKFVDYFSSIGFRCPQYTNPADFVFTAVLNNGYNLDSPNAVASKTRDISDSSNASSPLLLEDEKSRKEYLLNSWQQSTIYSELVRSVNSPILTPVTSSYFTSTIPFSSQFRLLSARAFKNMFRNPLIVRVRVAQSIIMGLLVGLIYYKSNRLDPSVAIQNFTGACFFSTVVTFLPTALNTISTFSLEKHVFQREFQNGFYKLLPYFSSKVLVELPFQILYPVLFNAISYYMVGFRGPFSHFLLQCATSIMVGLNSFALGLFASCFFDSIEVALSILPLIMVIPLIFGGFLVNTGTGFSWIKWLQWISPIKYGFTSLITNQFKNLVIKGQPLGNTQLRILSLGPFGIGESIAFLAMFFILLTFFSYVGLSLFIRQTSKLNDRSSKQKAILMGPPDSKFTEK